MSPTAKITSKGQVTIPAEVRAALRLKKGDHITFEQIGLSEFRLRSTSKPKSLSGMLTKYVKHPKTLEELKEGPAQHVRDKFLRKK